MDTKDILLYETGDGGDASLQNNDLALSETLYMQVYLALFGGNIEANTVTNTLPTEQRFDWWGNSLIMADTPNTQFNSNTERVLSTTALSSAGRLDIIRAVDADLSYLTELLDYSAGVELLSINRVRITVNFTPKTNQQNKVLILVYDNAKKELITEQTI